MSISRYSFVKKSKNIFGKEISSISLCSNKIFVAIENQEINYTVHILEEGERLDTLAGIHYNDSSLWWVIAASSGIGWGLQVPPGTIIRIPINLTEVLGIL